MPFVQGVCPHETLSNFAKLWIDFVQEEIKLQACLGKQEEVDEIALIERTKKGSNKDYKKKEGT
jgi:hypothetical protein